MALCAVQVPRRQKLFPPLAREPRERNRPTFQLPFARKRPSFEDLPTLSGVNFASSYFVFTPCSRTSFMPHFFRVLESKNWSDLQP